MIVESKREGTDLFVIIEPSISMHETLYRALRHRIMFEEIEPVKIFTITG